MINYILKSIVVMNLFYLSTTASFCKTQNYLNGISRTDKLDTCNCAKSLGWRSTIKLTRGM
jgi:hypothetical protein